MNKWNAVYVSELEHSYRRYLETHDPEPFKRDLYNGLLSTDEFEVAFAAALTEWMADRDFDMTDSIPTYIDPLTTPAFPKVYEHPTSDKTPLENTIPEFRKYNILISYFGEKE